MMKRSIVAALIALLISSSLVTAQTGRTTSNDKSETPAATRFEQFTARKGHIFIKTTYEGRDVPTGQAPIKVRGVSIGAPGETDRVFAVVFESEGRGTYARSSSVVLDFDEAVSLLAAIQSMKKIGSEMATTPAQNYTEVTFATKGDFTTGFFQQDGKQSAFVQLERFGTDGMRFGSMTILDALSASVGGVVEQLRTVGAR